MAYMLENEAVTALERLQTFEHLLDPTTRTLLSDYLPVNRMWIPGAGAGSIAKWAEGQVGQELLVTDIDTRYLDQLASEKVSVKEHDLITDSSPGEFDLIAVRLLLCHLPDRDIALQRLVNSLSPGGVLVIEEPARGVKAIDGQSKQLFNDTMALIRKLQINRGFSYDFAEQIPYMLHAFGMQEVRQQACWEICNQNESLVNLIRITWSHIADSANLDLSAVLEVLNDEDLVLASYKNIACTARKM